jgi:hypothetical protein
MRTDMTFDIIDYGRRLESVLQVQREMSAILAHHGERGDAREFFVESILRRFLPPSVVIGSGEIVDGVGGRSSQQDLLLYRSNFPVFDSLAGAHIYLAEGVLATIEVKSVLNAAEIERCSRNIASIRALTVDHRGLAEDLRVDGSAARDEELSWDTAVARIPTGGDAAPDEDPLFSSADERIWSYVFAFAGTSVDALIHNARTSGWLRGDGPDCACVLGSAFGALTNTPIAPQREPSAGEVFLIDETDQPLGWWLGHLVWVLGRPFRRPYLRPYFEKSLTGEGRTNVR